MTWYNALQLEQHLIAWPPLLCGEKGMVCYPSFPLSSANRAGQKYF